MLKTSDKSAQLEVTVKSAEGKSYSLKMWLSCKCRKSSLGFAAAGAKGQSEATLISVLQLHLGKNANKVHAS